MGLEWGGWKGGHGVIGFECGGFEGGEWFGLEGKSLSFHGDERTGASLAIPKAPVLRSIGNTPLGLEAAARGDRSDKFWHPRWEEKQEERTCRSVRRGIHEMRWRASAERV